MNKKIKDILQVSLISTVVFIIFIINLIKPASDISISERRKLAQFPNELNSSFMQNFDEYALDQFLFREQFRKINMYFNKNILKKQDINNLYLFDDNVVYKEYPLNQESLDHVTKIFHKINDKYLNPTNNIYFSIIPDKNYFLSDSKYLKINYEQFMQQLIKQNPQMQFIAIEHLLKLNDYYKSDPHWRQEKLIAVANHLAKQMKTKLQTDYEIVTINKPFYGSYASQLPISSEKISYLTNETIAACKVYDHENKRELKMYDKEKISSKDMYDFFLSGPLSLITITNFKAENNRELIIFRDSYASALAPLLASGYEKITLVDIRYLPSEQLGKYIDFNEKDVLFLYSTSVLNNSGTLK